MFLSIRDMGQLQYFRLREKKTPYGGKRIFFLDTRQVKIIRHNTQFPTMYPHFVILGAKDNVSHRIHLRILPRRICTLLSVQVLSERTLINRQLGQDTAVAIGQRLAGYSASRA